MRRLGRVLRHVLVWWLPGLLLLLALAGTAMAWLVGSQAGTQLLLTTAASQFGGRIEALQGSLWQGVRIGRYTMAQPGLSVDAEDLVISVAWPELLQRRLRVRELSAAALRIGLDPDNADHADEQATPSSDGVPSLPLDIDIESLAIGSFSLERAGQPLPVTLGGLQATLAANAKGARVRVDSLHVGHELAQVDLQAQADLLSLADPWPLSADVKLAATGTSSDSPLCLKQLAAAPAADGPDRNSVKKGAKNEANKKAKNEANNKAKNDPKTNAPTDAQSAISAALASGANACTVTADAHVEGSLQGLNLRIGADGAGAALALRAVLTPRGVFPLQHASLTLQLPDKSGASATLQATRTDDGLADRLNGTVAADRLDLGRLLGGKLPAALLNLHGGFDTEFTDGYVLRRGSVDMNIDQGSNWNRQPLSGTVGVRVATGAQANASAAWPDALSGVQVDRFDVDLRLGRNRVRTQGSAGAAGGELALNADAPELVAFWPGLSGAASAQGKLAGTPARHQLELRAAYTPAKARAGMLGRAKADVTLAVAGGWGPGTGTDAAAALVGWRGTVSRLAATHAGFDVHTARPVSVAYLPDAVAPAWQWQVGAASIGVGLPSGDRVTVDHAGSRGGGGRWETAGRMDNFVVTPVLVGSVIRAIDPDAAAARADQRGAAQVNADVPAAQRRIALDANWDMKFSGTLAGHARLARRGGDLRIPGDPPIPLGLKALVLDLTATPVSATTSRLDAALDLATGKMGVIDGKGSAMLAVGRDGGIALAPRQPLRASLNADIADLAWLGLFTGDAMELGGSLKANVQAQGMLDGPWQATGTIQGQKLRIVRIDDGVRLVDGTLSARLQDDNIILESLRFPASLRVVPTEARTKEWITTNPDAKNGYVNASGQWNLTRSTGKAHVVLYRFPALQRADRYAMVSGQIDIDAELPRLSVTGSLKADAGWASIEVLSGVPTLDDDVRVRRPGDQAEAASTPLQLSMDLNVDMGPRFYLTGMGLDTGLTGSIRIRYVDRRLSGTGQLNTRGGRIEAYGQRLQLRRGTVTFQGSLENPLLDIEALRTGEQVEAGVKVSGTAQRPRIDLVSYPDVSDVEKLSWLVLGRGPDASGNDTALLVSVGTALLGNGTPFYKQFGLDDVSVRNGAIGSSGSLLPDRTVAGDVNMDSDSTLATQFLVASKNLSNGITLSIEQALAGSETVGRASYRLARGLSLDLKGGSVNGLELIYRTFWGN